MGQLLRSIGVAVSVFLVMAFAMPIVFPELKGHTWLIASGCVAVIGSGLGAVTERFLLRRRPDKGGGSRKERTFLFLTGRQWIGSVLIAAFIFVSLLIAFPEKRTASWILVFAVGSLMVAVIPVIEKNLAHRLKK